MGIERRLERLEDKTTGPETWEIPVSVRTYIKHLENYRREEAGEPLIPLTPEEEAYEHEMDNDPEFQAYWKRLDKQVEEYEFE